VSERDLARSIGAASYHAARETRAIRRGVVDSIRDDGRAVVTLPNGAKVIRGSSGLHTPSAGESIVMTRSGQAEEILSSSAYGGGNGSAYVTP